MNDEQDDTIDLETLTNETDGEYIVHNINKSIHPVHVMFRRLVDSYALDLSIDPSTAAMTVLKEVKKEFPKAIVVKRIKVQQESPPSDEGKKSGGGAEYRFLKYHRMDALSKVSHIISTKRFNNRKRKKNAVESKSSTFISTNSDHNIDTENKTNKKLKGVVCEEKDGAYLHNQQQGNDQLPPLPPLPLSSLNQEPSTIDPTNPRITKDAQQQHDL